MLPVNPDAKRSHRFTLCISNRHDDCTLNTRLFCARLHIAALVALDVAGRNGLVAFYCKPSHSFADRNFLHDFHYFGRHADMGFKHENIASQPWAGPGVGAKSADDTFKFGLHPHRSLRRRHMDNDRQDLAAFLWFAQYGNPRAPFHSSLDNLEDASFAAEESVILAESRLDRESFEIAEMIEEQSADLSRHVMLAGLRMIPSGLTGQTTGG